MRRLAPDRNLGRRVVPGGAQRGGAGDGTAAPLSAEAAAAQIESQMPLAIKCERSDHIIDNSGSRDSLAET